MTRVSDRGADVKGAASGARRIAEALVEAARGKDWRSDPANTVSCSPVGAGKSNWTASVEFRTGTGSGDSYVFFGSGRDGESALRGALVHYCCSSGVVSRCPVEAYSLEELELKLAAGGWL